MKNITVFSHGFGVEKDDRGLFTDVAEGLDTTTKLFDYNIVDRDNNTLTVLPLSKQTKKLEEVVEQAKKNTDEINLVCHSQGCIVASLLKPVGIRKMVFLSAPAELGIKRMVELFEGRDGTSLNLEGISTLGRRDSSVTIVPPEYWQELDEIDTISLYNELAELTELTLINAKQDEIIGSMDFSGLSSRVKVVELDANHDFTGEARKRLVEAVKVELGSH